MQAPSGAVAVERLAVVPRRPDGRVDTDAVVDALRPLGTVAVLEAAGPVGAHSRWSYVTVRPGGRLLAGPDRAVLRTPGGTEVLGSDPLAGLDRCCRRFGLGPDPEPPAGPPFTGGLCGAVAYDLGRWVEDLLPRGRPGRPGRLLDLQVAETVVAVDRHRDRALLARRPMITRPGELARIAGDVRAALEGAAAAPARPSPAPAPPHRPVGGDGRVGTSLPPARYRRAVRAVLDRIGAGEVFQVNLAQRLTAAWGGGVHGLYRALREQSPAPHGAALPLAAGGLASISPETFLAVRGREATSRPIKGTRPRGGTADDDRRLAAGLCASPKDRAENVMIVDMQRNDLGRVATTGSVTVPELCALEAHPTVWHLVSTVTGTLRAGAGWGDLLRATLPPASVTGTPKVRALEVIAGLEPVGRGWYCGAFGFLGAGAADLAVAIRTATLHPGGRCDYGAGGGVVADSDPGGEHAESLDKAAAFLRAVGAERGGAGRVAS